MKRLSTTTVRWSPRSLLVKLFVATLMGASLPAIVATSATAATCNPPTYLRAWKLPTGKYICEYGYNDFRYDNRWHVFLVGTNRKIYHTWQSNPGGGPWHQDWVSLGGQGYGNVTERTSTYNGANVLKITVRGSDRGFYCKYYNHPALNGKSVWSPSKTSWYGGC